MLHHHPTSRPTSICRTWRGTESTHHLNLPNLAWSGVHAPPGFASTALALFATLALAAAVAAAPTSTWVHEGTDGKLAYQTTPRGDRVMDFSSAGYHGGGVALPEVPVRATVKSTGGGDDSAAIQAAIDQVSALPVRDGFRGAVLLEAGTFSCTRTLTLSTSGVVLRGSGSGLSDGPRTTLKLVGPRHVAVVIGNARRGATPSRRPSGENDDPAEGMRDKQSNGATRQTTLADTYLPAGSARITIADATGFAVGDTIAIRRPVTNAWVHRMQMDDLKREAESQTWIGENRLGVTERKITAINERMLTLDVPVADAYDANVLNPAGTIVAKIVPAPALSEVGVEHLHFQCPPLEIAYGQAPYSAVRLIGDDCWIRDVFCEETMNTTSLAGKRITLERVVVTHTFPNLGASKPSDFSIEGSQILINRCEATGGNTYFVWTSSLQPGPNVVLNSTFRGHGSRIQPHMRWSTGLLVDNCTIADGGIDFMNRGVAGSGHGWTMGWAVAWNCIADSYVIQNPPGAINWAIGCSGQQLHWPRMFDRTPLQPDGTFDAHGTPVAPQSLYLAQLAERKGPGALAAIGYRANSLAEFPNKAVPRSPALRREDDAELGPDLALHRPVAASAMRGRDRAFAGERALDGDPKTYWATNDDATTATLEIDLEGPVAMNAALLAEPLGQQAIEAFKVEGMGTSDWELLGEGTDVGDRKVVRFPGTTLWKVRVTVKASRGVALRKFGLYLAP